MAVCTFFGHRECPAEIKPVLRNTLEDLILNYGVDLFYVGNQGQFDACVRSVLRELTMKYLLVFAADNGVVAEGVSSAPQSVTKMQTVNLPRHKTGYPSLPNLRKPEWQARTAGIHLHSGEGTVRKDRQENRPGRFAI